MQRPGVKSPVGEMVIMNIELIMELGGSLRGGASAEL